MIVITNGTEYIYLDDQHQIQKTTDLTKAKTFTFPGMQYFHKGKRQGNQGLLCLRYGNTAYLLQTKEEKVFPKDHKNDDLQSGRRTLRIMRKKNQI